MTLYPEPIKHIFLKNKAILLHNHSTMMTPEKLIKYYYLIYRPYSNFPIVTIMSFIAVFIPFKSRIQSSKAHIALIKCIRLSCLFTVLYNSSPAFKKLYDIDRFEGFRAMMGCSSLGWVTVSRRCPCCNFGDLRVYYLIWQRDFGDMIKGPWDGESILDYPGG